MKIGKTLAAVAVIASMASSPAFAGTVTRSSAALPTAQGFAPVSQVRVATKLKKKSDAVQTVIIPIIVGGLVVGYTFYEIVIDDSEAISPVN